MIYYISYIKVNNYKGFKTMNIGKILELYPTQEICLRHLEKVRWGDKIKCAYCNGANTNTYKYQGNDRHYCNTCKSGFSATIGTIFQNSHIPLNKWFMLIALMLNAKKGLSAYQASRDLGIRRMTVWRMMNKIREAMGNATDNELLSGIVEMDETYVGGKPRKISKKPQNDNDDDAPLPPINKRGRGTKKECVVGMIERGGKVRAKHVKKTNLRFCDMAGLVRKNIDTGNSILMTDEYKAYCKMKRFMRHMSINHQYEYVRGAVHTNTIESFWALVKRGIVGQFHRVSAKYLYRYIDEFCWRFNNCKNTTAFDCLLSKCL
jgi:hypothetical protein